MRFPETINKGFYLCNGIKINRKNKTIQKQDTQKQMETILKTWAVLRSVSSPAAGTGQAGLRDVSMNWWLHGFSTHGQQP